MAGRKIQASATASAQRQREFFSLLDSSGGCHLAFNHLPEIRIVIKDRNCRFIWVTDNVPARHGFRSAGEMVGVHDRDINPAPLAEVYTRDDLEVIRSGRPLLAKTEISFNEAGLPDWFVVNKLPLRDRAGAVCGLIATIAPHRSLNRVPLHATGARKAADYIRANLGSRLKLPAIAKVAHVSVRQLQRQFLETAGLTPSEFIVRCRIMEACRLLRDTDAMLGWIAAETGFYDQSAFNKAFTKYLRIRPLDFRKARANPLPLATAAEPLGTVME